MSRDCLVRLRFVKYRIHDDILSSSSIGMFLSSLYLPPRPGSVLCFNSCYIFVVPTAYGSRGGPTISPCLISGPTIRRGPHNLSNVLRLDRSFRDSSQGGIMACHGSGRFNTTPLRSGTEALERTEPLGRGTFWNRPAAGKTRRLRLLDTIATLSYGIHLYIRYPLSPTAFFVTVALSEGDL